MPPSEKPPGLKRTVPVLQRIEQLHPYKLFCYLTIASSILFHLFLIISFLQKSGFEFGIVGPQHFPKTFHITSLLLVSTLIVSPGIIKSYLRDQVQAMRKKLSQMVISGLIPIILQALAYLELLGVDTPGQEQLFDDYLYLFSAVLTLHVLASTIFIGFQFYKITAVEGDPVKSLILLTNPYEKVKLEIYVAFWNYTVAAWLFVYLFYLLVY